MNDLLASAATTELFVNMALMSWDTTISRTNKLLQELPDNILQNSIAPNRNTGAWVVGHLVAVHDAMLPVLGLGERFYPELEGPFLKNTETSNLSLPQLREYWNKVNTTLRERMATLQPEEWFQRHTLVSEADFAKEPFRNKLNLLINRTGHVSYHLGQLVFLKPKQ